MNRDELTRRVREFRAPSPSFSRLVTLLGQPDVDSEDVIRVVRQDGVLSAKLLSLCNSAALGTRDIGSIDQAVLYLGQKEVFRLAILLGCGAMISPALTGYGMEPKALWRHSLLTALITGQVMTALPDLAEEPGVAYTAGLLHDIGKVVLNQMLDAPTQVAIHNDMWENDCSLLVAERKHIGVDHAEVGARLLEEWRLPPIIVEAVGRHHSPVLQPADLKLSAVVHIADMLAHQAGSAPGWGSYSVTADASLVEALGLTSEAMQNLLIATLDFSAQVEEMAVA